MFTALGLPELIGVADALNKLVLNFDMRVLILEGNAIDLLVLRGHNKALVQLGRFTHKLAGAIDSLVISSLEVRLGRL